MKTQKKLQVDPIDMTFKLTKLGLPLEQVADILGISKRTLERRMHIDEKLRTAIESGRANQIKDVSEMAYQMAVSGKHPSMTMFWLKCRAGWSSTPKEEPIEPPQSDVPENIRELLNLSDEELAERSKILEAELKSKYRFELREELEQELLNKNEKA